MVHGALPPLVKGWLGMDAVHLPHKPPKPKNPTMGCASLPPTSPPCLSPTVLHQPTHPPMTIHGGTHSPPSKCHHLAPIPDELGELIAHDLVLLHQLGWEGLICSRQGHGDFASLNKMHHPVWHLLCQYKHHGAPVILKTAPWTPEQCAAAIQQGPHKSAHEYVGLLAY